MLLLYDWEQLEFIQVISGVLLAGQDIETSGAPKIPRQIRGTFHLSLTPADVEGGESYGIGGVHNIGLGFSCAV